MYALDGIGAPSRLSVMRRAAALASTSPTLLLIPLLKGSALEVECVKVVGLRKLPSVGLKILGGFAVCL